MPRQKKPKITFTIPKDVYGRVLTPDQTRVLIENNWRESYRYTCQDCRARGCEKCHQMGIILQLQDPRSSRHEVRAAPFFYPETGAALSAYWAPHQCAMFFTLDAQLGSARYEMQLPQLWELMRVIVNLTANPRMDARETQLGFAVAATLFGPPVMHIAGLKTKGQAAQTLKNTQRDAVRLLHDAGLDEEANFLEQALKHECFQVEPARRKAVRATLGKLKPGTILERNKHAAVFIDAKGKEHVAEMGDESRSALGVLP